MCKESDYMAYQGYLIQIGGDYKIPHSMIKAESYKVTRHGQDLDSTRDEDGHAHRTALEHFVIKAEFETPPLKTTAQMEEMLGNIRSRYTNVTEQKLMARMYVPMINDYVEQEVYVPDVDFELYFADDKEIKYNPIRLAFIGY